MQNFKHNIPFFANFWKNNPDIWYVPTTYFLTHLNNNNHRFRKTRPRKHSIQESAMCLVFNLYHYESIKNVHENVNANLLN